MLRRAKIAIRRALLLAGALAAFGVPARAAAPAEPAPAFERRPVRLPPLFWYEKDVEERQRLLMVSMLYWDVEADRTSHRLLLPVFYRWREEDRSLLVSLPFVAAYRKPQERWLVAGPFYRASDEKFTKTAFFPLYWQRARPGGGRVTAALPFLFYDYRNRDRSKVDQVSLLGWYRRRPEGRTGALMNVWWSTDEDSSFVTLFPVYWRRDTPVRRLSVLGPFFLRRERGVPAFGSKERLPVEQTYAGLFPLAGGGWGKRSTHYLFPLHYRARAEGENSFATLPFSRFRLGDRVFGHVGPWFYSRDPDLRVGGLFPLGFDLRAADGFERRTQVLTFYRRRENEDVFHTLFPLYGYWGSPDAANLLSWGVWWRRKAEFSSGWAYLYHWKTQADGGDTRVLFPLYWHYWRPPDWGVDVVFPFYTRFRSGDVKVTAVPPVIWRETPDRRTWSFLFLYWRDHHTTRGSTTLFPFFHQNYGPRGRRFFSPLVWTRRSALSREGLALAPPVYWYRSAEVKRTIAFPLYWSADWPAGRLRVVPPYYRWRNGERHSYGLLPLWGRHRSPKERGGYLFPFYWYSTNGRGDGLWLVPPLAMTISRRGTGTESYHMHTQYLLLGGVDKTTTTFQHDFFPLYKYVRAPDYANFWAPRMVPLAAWERRKETRKGYVFPYLWRRGPEKDWELFIPLYYASRLYETVGSTETTVVRAERKGGARVVFPLYWSGSGAEGKSYRYVLPLYAQYAERDRRLRVFMPLWASYDAPAGGKFRVLFPLYWRFRLAARAEADGGRADPRDIAVFGPWYRVTTERPGRPVRTVGLAPFFSSTRSGEEDRYFEVLGGLFARDVQGGRRRFRFLWIFSTKGGA